MIANHSQFIDALKEERKVRVRFYSPADSGVVDCVCAPMDYGPGKDASADGLHRYWLWDRAGRRGRAGSPAGTSGGAAGSRRDL
jgi:hypothetical protein